MESVYLPAYLRTANSRARPASQIGPAFVRQYFFARPLQAILHFLVLFPSIFCDLLPLPSLHDALEWEVTRPHWLNVAIELKHVPLDVILACSMERISSL